MPGADRSRTGRDGRASPPAPTPTARPRRAPVHGPRDGGSGNAAHRRSISALEFPWVSRAQRNGRTKQSRYAPADGAGVVNPRARQRAFCIAVLPHDAATDGQDELAELKELLRTAGVAVAGELVQRRALPDPN